MAIKQIVPIYITLLGDAAATTFVFPVQNLFQQGFGGSVPFGVTGSIPSSASANNPPYAVTSVAVDANGNITITFTSAPPAVEFQIELDITFNSGSATSSTPTVSQNVTLTGTSTVSISGTVPVTQSTSPWVVSLTSTTITGTVAVTQSTSPWVVAGNLTHNNAVPAATNIGVLPAVASTAAPTYTTGDQVLLSTDLAGNLRVSSAGGTQSSNIIQWNSVALGSPSNYGTSPGAVSVIGVNAFVTNTVPVTLTSTTITGTVTAVGNLTNNNAAPTAALQGVLPAIAETAYTTVTYTTGDMVLPVTDLHGALNQDLQAY